MASCTKVRRVDREFDSLDDIPHFTNRRIGEIAKVVDTLCFDLVPYLATVTVRPVKILNSNAADRSGVSFSEAYCSVVPSSDKVYLLGDIFRRGVEIVTDFLEERKLPNNKQERYVLSKFLHFVEKDDQDSFEDIDLLTEAQLTTLLANHLFGKLSTSPEYNIDENCAERGKDKTCACGKPDCKLSGSYGDTSIGNTEVWHGRVAVIINGELGVEPLEDTEESPMEVKSKFSHLSRNSQLIAETIVFSFLQRKRHPEKDFFLNPCIGVGNAELIILFYDSEHDVLLETAPVSLLDSRFDGSSSKKLSLLGVMVSWLVVNYKYLCSGSPDELKSSKAGFFEHTKQKIEVYQKQLKFQNVGTSITSGGEVSENSAVTTSDFVFQMHTSLSKVIFGASGSESHN